MKQYLREILYLAGEDKKKLPVLFLIFLIQTLIEVLGIGLIAPYISLLVDFENTLETLSFLIDFFGLPSSRINLLVIIGVLLVAIFAFKIFIGYFVNSKIINFVQDKRVDLSQKLMSKYQALPYVEYMSRNSSEYIYRIQALTYSYSNEVLAPLMKLLSDGVVALAILAFLAYYNIYALLLLVFLLFTIIGLYDLVTKKQAKENGILGNKYATSMVQHINEGIDGLKEIRILGKEEYFYEKLLRSAQNFSKTAKKAQLLAVLPKFLLEMVLIIFVVSIVIIGSVSNTEPSLLISTLGVFGVAAIRLLPVANLVSSSIVSIRFARNGVSLLFGDCQKGDIDETRNPESIVYKTKSFEKLSLSDISYKYPGSNVFSLKGINLDIKAGEAIGIIGQSGSGKTTLIDLILGLLDPSTGCIRVNSEELTNKCALNKWRNEIAYLPQQVFLTDSTLRNNVALGVNDDEIDEIKIHASLKQAALTKVVDLLPDGINTPMGERGVRLSGGQAQRVALARAFYHGREVLIMDESTSALDNATEKEIIQEIHNLKGKVTMIVIAHRLTTLQHCDRIYELQEGKLINSGTYEDVIKNT
jgi:ATP-binding cassette, subfamily B, bacterial PglK